MTNVISVICDDYNDDSIKDLTKIKSFYFIAVCIYFDAVVQMCPLGGAVILQKYYFLTALQSNCSES